MIHMQPTFGIMPPCGFPHKAASSKLANESIMSHSSTIGISDASLCILYRTSYRYHVDLDVAQFKDQKAVPALMLYRRLDIETDSDARPRRAVLAEWT